MNNTMNFSYMTRICHEMIKTCQTQNNKKSSTEFQDKLIEKSLENAEVSKIVKSQMSMEEYKLYIYDKIAGLPLHSSNMYDSISVHISDAGFEAMKNDAEYEKWVLDTLRNNFQAYDAWSGICGGKFSVFYFGASKEESHGECWRMGFRNGSGNKIFEDKSKDSFWERRLKRRQELKEQLEELEEKKAIAKRMAKSEYYVQLAKQENGYGETMKPVNCDLLAMQFFSSLKAGVLFEAMGSKKVKV